MCSPRLKKESLENEKESKNYIKSNAQKKRDLRLFLTGTERNHLTVAVVAAQVPLL